MQRPLVLQTLPVSLLYPSFWLRLETFQAIALLLWPFGVAWLVHWSAARQARREMRAHGVMRSIELTPEEQREWSRRHTKEGAKRKRQREREQRETDRIIEEERRKMHEEWGRRDSAPPAPGETPGAP